jgi:hypothetical protein
VRSKHAAGLRKCMLNEMFIGVTQQKTVTCNAMAQSSGDVEHLAPACW